MDETKSHNQIDNPDSKVHGANIGPTWILSAPDGPHVGPVNLATWEIIYIVSVIMVNHYL